MNADISPEALQDLGSSTLAQSFAGIWVERYPHLNLVTEAKFVKDRRFRADFAAGNNWLWSRPNKDGFCKRKLFLPPGVIIEANGGVHRHKFESDAEREAIALSLGFRYHRVYWQTLELVVEAIAKDVEEVLAMQVAA